MGGVSEPKKAQMGDVGVARATSDHPARAGLCLADVLQAFGPNEFEVAELGLRRCERGTDNDLEEEELGG